MVDIECDLFCLAEQLPDTREWITEVCLYDVIIMVNVLEKIVQSYYNHHVELSLYLNKNDI